MLQQPRVALLFLTKGQLFHEPTWKTWFKSAAGFLHVGSACRHHPDWNAVEASCERNQASDDVITNQHLFSVYVHAPPVFELHGKNVSEYPEGSIWRRHLIADRVEPAWGDITLVVAARNLLWEAYKDPLNTRFVLISESDIPLWDPLTMYAQLLGEQRSRVEACGLRDRDLARMTWRMMGAGFSRRHWRKSSQWFMLVRSHVGIVLEDEEVFRRFEQWCWTGWDEDYQAYRTCVADEHYIPTLLAGVHGLKGEMRCDSVRGVAAADWSRGGAHPKSFSADGVTPALIDFLRSLAFPCNATSAKRAVQQSFIHVLERNSTCREERTMQTAGQWPPPLQQECFLTARKFDRSTVEVVHRLFQSCNDTLGLAARDSCHDPPSDVSL